MCQLFRLALAAAAQQEQSFLFYQTVELAESVLSLVFFLWTDLARSSRWPCSPSQSVTLIFAAFAQVVQDVYLFDCHANIVRVWIRSYTKGIKVPWGVQTVQMRCISSKYGCAR